MNGNEEHSGHCNGRLPATAWNEEQAALPSDATHATRVLSSVPLRGLVLKFCMLVFFTRSKHANNLILSEA